MFDVLKGVREKRAAKKLLVKAGAITEVKKPSEGEKVYDMDGDDIINLTYLDQKNEELKKLRKEVDKAIQNYNAKVIVLNAEGDMWWANVKAKSKESLAGKALHIDRENSCVRVGVLKGE